MKRLLIIFSLMVASVFPTLFFFSNNMGEMMYERIYWQLFAYFVAPLIVFPLANLFIKNDNKTGLIVLLSILSYHFVSIMNYAWYSHIFTWTALSILLGIIVYKWKNDKVKNLLMRTICIIFPILLVMNLIPIATFFLDPKKIRESDVFITTKNIDNNIYYIVIDSYDREDVLKYLGYEGKLSSFLINKGFYVAEESSSNYPWTYMSLPSTLNMRYINNNMTGKNSSDYQYIAIEMINNSVISRTLKGLGYQYIVAPYDSRIKNTNADYVFALEDSSESSNITHANTIKYQFSILNSILDMEGKKFVFIDILCPHSPYVFRANGDFYDDSSSTDVYNKNNFIEQSKFIEKNIMISIENIMSKDEKAIIILQSDHGSYLTFDDGNKYNFSRNNMWTNPNYENLYERTSILNAFYFPDGDYSLLRKDITSVNTFIILLKKYFGYEGELLDEKIYWSGSSLPPKFVDVTERVRKEVK